MSNLLPRFPESLPVSRHSRDVFLEAYENGGPPVSDLAFNTLFAWQEYFKYEYFELEGFLFVFYEKDGKYVVLPPLFLSKQDSGSGWPARFAMAAKAVAENAENNGFSISFEFFPELYCRQLRQIGVETRPSRDAFDYVYLKEDLASLKGRGYDGKRNFVKQFERNYGLTYRNITKENLNEAKIFLKSWHAPKAKNDIIGSAAYCMACRLADNYDFLDVCGGILTVDDKIVAATLGTITDDFAYEKGPSSTVIVHHENGLLEYKGVYQAINQMFCQNLPERVVYVNREEDLGIPGLRKAKMSYHPAMMVEKSVLSV
ncbi:MAG: DUF2156 domain-containing protein [Endomicrobiales bacterium]|nr:DUF2156 domain-containing protein [Endomicrobiales bacterium]